MTNIVGSRRFTDAEKSMLLTTIGDYMLFGVQEPEMLELIKKKLGRPISVRTLYKLKNEVKTRNGTAEAWLDKYARSYIADFYRQRIEELQHLQTNLFLILDNEKKKGGIDKINVYRYNTIAKTIIDNSKVLAEYGMGPPIISKIKELLPVDINELNRRVERQKSLVDDAVINITDDDVIDADTLTENEQSELTRIRETIQTAKSAIGLHINSEDPGRTSTEDSEPDSQDSQRVF